ncbi:MAG TPA: HWE histidine kinase domain-containing protein [Aestuariivirga sp.]|nr:HWE histidine kinase domain-containing protein [Aestuariivirga sp.]
MDIEVRNGRPAPNEPTGSLGIWDVDRLRFATDAAGVALWSWNVDTDKITLDDRGFDLWGIPRAPNVTFEELSARIHPADLDKVRAAFAATREHLGAYETDFRILLGEEVRWISARGRGDDQGMIGRLMYGIFIDVSVRRHAEEAREVITGEMHHRIKNLFSLSSALAGIASRSTTTKEEMARDLMRRLMALSEAHELIRPDSTMQSAARELSELLTVLLKPYLDDDVSKNRVTISVPRMLVGEHSATAVALVVHELATNSMKYGALSVPTGNLAISGLDQGEDVEINWLEYGGPTVISPPHVAGFGSRLVTSSVEGQLGGTITVDWAPQGIAAKLKLNKVRLGA